MKNLFVKQVINLVVAISVIVSCVFLIQSVFCQKTYFSLSMGWLLVGILSFLVLHIVKFIRLYFLLNESNINTDILLKLYLQCTIVNLLIPFKLGEIYRWYRLGDRIQDYKTALLSLITERFFDISVVLGIMIAGVCFSGTQINSTIIIFALITLCVLLCYNGFTPTYRYLNGFFVTKRTSSKDIIALKVLDKCADWNYHQKKITKNKSVMIFILSIVIWSMEFITLSCVAHSYHSDFGLNGFTAYISMNVGIEMSSASLFVYYVLFSLILACALLGISLGVHSLLKRRSCEQPGESKDGEK